MQTMAITYSVKKVNERLCPWLTALLKREMTEFEGENTLETRRLEQIVRSTGPHSSDNAIDILA